MIRQRTARSRASPAIFGHRTRAVTVSENGESKAHEGRILISKERAMTTKHRSNERRLVYKWVDSPVGRLKLVATDKGVTGILWEEERPGRVRLSALVEDPSHTVLVEAERQLGEYFRG